MTNCMTWKDMWYVLNGIKCDISWQDLTWHVMIFDMTGHVMWNIMWQELTWHDMWHDMKWFTYDMMTCDIANDMACYEVN